MASNATYYQTINPQLLTPGTRLQSLTLTHSFQSFHHFVRCIANMLAKLLSLCLLVVAALGVVQAGTSIS